MDLGLYMKNKERHPNKFKNYRTLRVLGRAIRAPVLKALDI